MHLGFFLAFPKYMHFAQRPALDFGFRFVKIVSIAQVRKNAKIQRKLTPLHRSVTFPACSLNLRREH